MNPNRLWIVCLSLLFGAETVSAQNFNDPLIIPDTINSDTVHLYLKDTHHLFMNDVQTETYAMNASYLGPTIIMNVGDHMYMNVHNQIGETTTMHWHGMHVAPEYDGGPHTAIEPNETWHPDFEVIEEAITF
jgi:bilirubin oxidase